VKKLQNYALGIRAIRCFCYRLFGLGSLYLCSSALAVENTNSDLTFTIMDDRSTSGPSNDLGTVADSTNDMFDLVGYVWVDAYFDYPVGSDTGAKTFNMTLTPLNELDRWSTFQPSQPSTATVYPGNTALKRVSFRLGLCQSRDGLTGNFPEYSTDFSAAKEYQVGLIVDGVEVETAIVTIDIFAQAVVPQSSSTPTSNTPIDILQIEFTYGTPRPTAGNSVVVDLDLHAVDQNGEGPIPYEVGYFDPEIPGTSVVLASGTIPEGSLITIQETFVVPDGNSLYASSNSVLGQEIEGLSIFFPTTDPDAWSAYLAWGYTKESIWSAQYTMLHPISGSYELFAAGRLIGTFPFTTDATGTNGPVQFVTAPGLPLTLNFGNVSVSEVQWYQGDSTQMLKTDTPGLDSSDLYFLTFNVIGLTEPGDAFEVGSSTQNTSGVTSIVDGVTTTAVYRTSQVTRADGSTYSTTVAGDTGQQITSEGVPLTTGEALEIQMSRNVADGAKALVEFNNRQKEYEAFKGEGGRESAIEFVEGFDSAVEIGKLSTIFPEAMAVGDIPTFNSGSNEGWIITGLGSTINLDPSSHNGITSLSVWVKSLFTALISGLLVWYVINKIHESSVEVTKVTQLSFPNIQVAGFSVGTLAIPVVLALGLTVATTIPTLMSGYLNITGGEIGSATTIVKSATDNLGDTGGKITYLISFFFPLNHFFITLGNAVGFFFARGVIFQVYAWLLKSFPQ
jgi:hypothetical protein